MYEIWITDQESGQEGPYDGPYESMDDAEEALSVAKQEERPKGEDLWIHKCF